MENTIDAVPNKQNDSSQELGIDKLIKGFPAAVEIAQTRAQLEQKIFTDGIPLEQWGANYESVLSQHPNMQPYRKVFDEAFYNTYETRKRVDSVWEYACESEGEHPKNVHLEKASPKVAVRICRDLTGFNPRDEVGAQRGPTTIRIFLSDRDWDEYFRDLGGYSENQGDGLFTYFKNIPLVAMKRSSGYEDKSEEGFVTMFHELEHGQYLLLKAVGKQLMTEEKFPIPDNIAKGIQRKELDPYDNLANEILANMTVLEIMPQLNEEQLELAKKVFEELVDVIAKDYAPESNNRDVARNAKEIGLRGIDSIVDLYSYFIGFDPSISSARMTINLLAQFPIDKWPTVARLLKSRQAKFKPEFQR